MMSEDQNKPMRKNFFDSLFEIAEAAKAQGGITDTHKTVLIEAWEQTKADKLNILLSRFGNEDDTTDQ